MIVFLSIVILAEFMNYCRNIYVSKDVSVKIVKKKDALASFSDYSLQNLSLLHLGHGGHLSPSSKVTVVWQLVHS